jgi:pyrrolysyl-tRNA synthetase-like protein
LPNVTPAAGTIVPDPSPTTGFTATQRQRLRELGADAAAAAATFADAAARDQAFRRLETELVSAGRAALEALRTGPRLPALRRLEESLRAALTQAGLVEVVTPAMVGGDALRKMGVEPGSELGEQVFRLDGDRCLRPMLAPNLYTLLRRLDRIWKQPFSIYEMGSCFRRDTKGSRHLNEFTMLNLVELGTPLESRDQRLRELAVLVLEAAGVRGYEFTLKHSEVYGDELDVVVAGLEVCSTALGPHPLDDAWAITDPWVGLGFGLERLLVARDGLAGIERVGRSLSYLDGIRLQL